MDEKMKETLKMIGIVLGIGVVISGVAYLFYKMATDQKVPTDTAPSVEPEPVILPLRNYTATEVKQMQSWLYSEGIKSQNQLILDSIMKTGGIDGVMGRGFNAALAEAIRAGIVNSLSDLYRQAVN